MQRQATAYTVGLLATPYI